MLRFTLCCVLCVAGAARSNAQTISGVVADDTGAVLPAVVVELRTARIKVVSTASDAAGSYRLTAPSAGAFDVVFSLINFADVTKRVSLRPGEHLVVNAVLPLMLTAEVAVTGHRTFRNIADAPNPEENLIGLADAASEGAVTAKQLENRPMIRPGEVLETVPGLVISQHSGEGKANQYYLRGFNLDHGTDFAVSVAGVPVNMPTHGHGQGWSDVNFLIPELVSGVQFKKGPYYAEEGDFSTAGAANINYVNVLDRPFVRVNFGADAFGRVLAAASPRVGKGSVLAAIELGHNDGPWDRPEGYRRVNGVLRFTVGDGRNGFSVTAMGYDASWNATDQIPRRAVRDGVISRFGNLDPSDGGRTHRYTLSADAQRSGLNSVTRLNAYAMEYGLDLFSNFTYFLNDPINGDQFEQVDERSVFGGRASHRRRFPVLGRTFEHVVGVQVRHDRIGPLALHATRERRRIATTREDTVRQTSLGAYYQIEVPFSDRLRTTAGLRADAFRFAIRSDRPENTGRETAGIVSPKLGVALTATRRLELYGNFGYGYHSNDGRGTTLTRDPATGAPTARVTPLVRTRGEEIGVRSILLPKTQMTVAIWGLTLDSELLFIGDAGTTEAGRPSRRYGIEWTNYFSPWPWLAIDADVAWSAARFTDDDAAGSAIPGAVGRVASIGMAISDTQRMSAGLRLRHLGPRPLIEDDSVRSQGSVVLNLEGGYRVSRNVRLVVDVLNALGSTASDIEYFYQSRLPNEPADGLFDIHTHPVQPRTVRLGVRVGF